ncbi:L-rhamnose/proton symporter RhaT [Sodalis glossinidius]|uniref:L-rhamnose/proton symporter RhaT n=1 Tax=Sodalis glossinidius TaxID=63612 RepID=UPI00031B5096|nr:L-rhamnose/proton symporter RhaT [Sodalis glossinidius]
MRYILATPTWVLAIAATCGFLWGISAIWYGKGIDSIGLSLTVGINTSVGCSLGSLIPLFILGTLLPARSLSWLLAGMAVMIVGVSIITHAGILKDQQSKLEISRVKNEKFVSILLMALASGFSTAAMNIV